MNRFEQNIIPTVRLQLVSHNAYSYPTCTSRSLPSCFLGQIKRLVLIFYTHTDLFFSVDDVRT